MANCCGPKNVCRAKFAGPSWQSAHSDWLVHKAAKAANEGAVQGEWPNGCPTTRAPLFLLSLGRAGQTEAVV